MKKNLLKVVSTVALASTLVACGKTEKMTDAEKAKWATDNGYVLNPGQNGYTANDQLDQWAADNDYVKAEAEKELLEVTFNNYEDETKNLTNISYADLDAKFEGGFDFIVMLGNSTCSTCATLKSYMGDWVAETKYTVYYISDLTTEDAKKSAVMTKLGNPTTWPKLYAVVDGQVKDILSFGGSEEVTDAKVKPFIEQYFEMEEFKAETKRFATLAEYRAAVASGEQFIIYVGRDACPDCKNLSNIDKDDSLRKYFTEYEGKIYSIISEDTIAEHANSTVWNDVTKWNGFWGTVTPSKTLTADDITAGKTLAQVQSGVSGNNKAENLAYMIAAGEFTAAELALGQDAFLTRALEIANDAYLNDDGTHYMRDSIRSVPGLAAVNFDHKVEYAKEGDSIFGLIQTYAGDALGTKVVGTETYRTISTTKTIQVYDATAEKFVDQSVTYVRYVPKALNLGSNAGVEGKNSPFTGDNGVALWITHKNAFVGALGGKGAANFGTYTNNMSLSNIYTDCLTSRNPNYHTVYELEMVQAQTMNWMTSWKYTPAA